MEINLLLFGITREIIGRKNMQMTIPENHNVANLRERLLQDFPSLARLKSIMIAVNNEYADDQFLLHNQDEVALIPPVSGG